MLFVLFAQNRAILMQPRWAGGTVGIKADCGLDLGRVARVQTPNRLVPMTFC